jgi:hypothetical protein
MRKTEYKYFGRSRIEKRGGFNMLSLNLFFIGVILYKNKIEFMRLI